MTCCCVIHHSLTRTAAAFIGVTWILFAIAPRCSRRARGCDASERSVVLLLTLYLILHVTRIAHIAAVSTVTGCSRSLVSNRSSCLLLCVSSCSDCVEATLTRTALVFFAQILLITGGLVDARGACGARGAGCCTRGAFRSHRQCCYDMLTALHS